MRSPPGMEIFLPQWSLINSSVHFSSVAQLCPTLCDPMDCSMAGLPVYHQLLEFTQKLTSIELVMASNHLILCRPLLLLPSIFPSIRVFSNESALRTRWPKYWSFSFNISPPYTFHPLCSTAPVSLRSLSFSPVHDHFSLLP